MQLVFHGGAREVGRSCIEISSDSKRILLDCGLKITPHDSEYPIGFDYVQDIDAVFISHAHLDHTGGLPLLDHRGMNCPIFATKATKAITRLLLRDAFKIGKINHQHLGYNKLDIKKVLSCMNRVKMDRMGEYAKIKYEFFDAGHIPGAASVFLDVEGTTFLYTGDINTDETCLHHAAKTDFPKIDNLICESTYGDREHPDRHRTEDEFIKRIKSIVSKGGSIVIPVFAVGRAQEILLLLAQQNFKVPVYFDGMGITATQIALETPEEIKDARALKQAINKVKEIRKDTDRMAVVKKQSIIVTTSGMLTGGPALYYLKFLMNNPENAILLTGYQGVDTNGRLLLEKGQLFIDGWKKKVGCYVEQFDFSAHAGKSGLKALVRKVKPKKVFFVHGEEKSVLELKEWADAIGIKAYAPKLGEIINI